ncbi:hypothetical protein COD78_29005 [Bacillus cereus]|uniref:hypothetical protein n=1 Tax=Bacillus cereus TaxID=1396 RepID=UPI000BF569CA|nr:hypothetical protein [Bacillus cereus]PEX02334.1 hypothetical protein CN454_32470 [Bacillus cereus]PGV18153.1 hypothetical protein COD78_29005 [Bacillus cereus]
MKMNLAKWGIGILGAAVIWGTLPNGIGGIKQVYAQESIESTYEKLARNQTATKASLEVASIYQDGQDIVVKTKEKATPNKAVFMITQGSIEDGGKVVGYTNPSEEGIDEVRVSLHNPLSIDELDSNKDFYLYQSGGSPEFAEVKLADEFNQLVREKATLFSMNTTNSESSLISGKAGAGQKVKVSIWSGFSFEDTLLVGESVANEQGEWSIIPDSYLLPGRILEVEVIGKNGDVLNNTDQIIKPANKDSNYFDNGSFQKGISGWYTLPEDNQIFEQTIDGGRFKVANSNVDILSATQHSMQFEANQAYNVSFDIKVNEFIKDAPLSIIYMGNLYLGRTPLPEESFYRLYNFVGKEPGEWIHVEEETTGWYDELAPVGFITEGIADFEIKNIKFTKQF